MKRVGFLFEGMASFASLRAAALRAARGHRGGSATDELLFRLEPIVFELQRELTSRTYRPRPYRTFSVRDPKPRTISAADIRDRVVQHALCAAIEPVLERVADSGSYACRRGRGSHQAIAKAQTLSRRYRYFLKLDVRRFFASVDHAVLKALLRRLLKDPNILWLCDVFIDAGAPGSVTGKGLPIGNLTSQHFANFYLAPLDRFVRQETRARGYVRYMDDLLLFADSKRELHGCRERIEAFLREHLMLELKAEATRLAPVSEGIPFLGFRIFPATIRWSAASKRRFCKGVRLLIADLDAGRRSEEEVADRLRSRIAHASHADTLAFRRVFFENLRQGTGTAPARTG